MRALHPGPVSWGTLGDLLRDPLVYAVVVMGVLGVLAFAAALQDGSVGTATAVLTVTEVVVPGVLGLILLGTGSGPARLIPAAVGTRSRWPVCSC